MAETPAAGSRFEGWKVEPASDINSGCSGTEAACTLKPPGAGLVRVSATFELIPLYTLELLQPGFGSGTLTSSPAGVVCPGALTCAAEFQEATTVLLRETPAAGSVFTGWQVTPAGAVTSGCAALESTCTVRMSQATTVTGTFAPLLEGLEVSVTGAGMVGSRVGGEPGPISQCTATGGACAAELQEGTVVTLTEKPLPGERFAGWSGACAALTGTRECRLTITAATALTATFEAIPPPPPEAPVLVQPPPPEPPLPPLAWHPGAARGPRGARDPSVHANQTQARSPSPSRSRTHRSSPKP